MDFVRASMEVVSDTELGELTYAVYLQLDDNVLQDFGCDQVLLVDRVILQH